MALRKVGTGFALAILQGINGIIPAGTWGNVYESDDGSYVFQAYANGSKVTWKGPPELIWPEAVPSVAHRRPSRRLTAALVVLTAIACLGYVLYAL